MQQVVKARAVLAICIIQGPSRTITLLLYPTGYMWSCDTFIRIFKVLQRPRHPSCEPQSGDTGADRAFNRWGPVEGRRSLCMPLRGIMGAYTLSYPFASQEWVQWPCSAPWFSIVLCSWHSPKAVDLTFKIIMPIQNLSLYFRYFVTGRGSYHIWLWYYTPEIIKELYLPDLEIYHMSYIATDTTFGVLKKKRSECELVYFYDFCCSCSESGSHATAQAVLVKFFICLFVFVLNLSLPCARKAYRHKLSQFLIFLFLFCFST